MAAVICDDLQVCVDCAMLIANGEASPEHAEKVSEIWGDDCVNLVLSCGDECDESFSWSDCDGCGSSLGGTRHEAALIR